ncbi:cyclic nucleotide-binding domain-containing protein [Desertibaculum subflavum]|uniref:cyclic nucleotide-binding domain-containing protein n=1 Tax=Desertibaculum subflavum TaxID=2268458 RepID=UPI000E66C2E9
MSLNEEVDLLRRVPLFAKLEPSKLKLLAFTSERLTFQPGQALIRQGDMGDAAYVIMDGQADVQVETPQGPLTVAHLKRNDFVGEMAILCDVPRTATVIATEQLVTLRIAKELFFRLVTEFPQMAVEIMRVLAQRVEKTTADLRDANNKVRELEGKLQGKD